MDTPSPFETADPFRVALLTLSEILLLFVGVRTVSRGAMDRLAVAADMETKRGDPLPAPHDTPTDRQ